MVSIKDVAKRCGTSISTVSNVINGTKYVKPDLEERIRSAIEELGYEVNPVARSLKSKKSYTVGVIITNIDRIFFTRVIKGIQEVMTRAGYRLTFCNTNDSLETEQSFFNMLCSNWVDGIIVDSAADQDHTGWYRQMAEAHANTKKIPIVGLECRMDAYGMDSVGIDNEKAAFDATQALLQKGCTRIAHIAGVAGSPLTRARQKGFLCAAEGHMCSMESGDFSPNSGYEAMNRLLDGGMIPDGLFAANDQMAVGAIHALSARGIDIPSGIKVVGFDDTFVASLVKPSLSTIHVPKYSMGVCAAEQLLLRMGGDESEPRHIELPYKLIDRQSTGNETPVEWDMVNW
jgi:LacI family transcriptional regulator